MKKNSKQIPTFATEDKERDFWDEVDATDYFNTTEEVEIDFSQLKPSTESISLRLPSSMLRRIKQVAHSRDIPYQSLMKIYLANQLSRELKNRSI